MARTALTVTAQPAEVHAKTGLPIARATEFRIGDLVTEHSGSDGYPAVVVGIGRGGKDVYVRWVNFVLGNVTESSHVNYLDDTTLVIDPASVEAALAAGIEGAHKYVLKVSPQADRGASYNEKQRVGHDVFHRAAWRTLGGYGGLSQGARYRRDPHR